MSTRHLTDRTWFAVSALFAAALAGCGGGSSSAVVGTTGSSGVTPPTGDTVYFANADYLVEQNAGSVSMSVNRSGSTASAISVSYNTVDGTAVAGSDYTATSGTLEWAENDSSAKNISVAISNADPYSGTKAFTAELTTPSGATLADPSTATVTVGGSGTTPTTTFWVYYNGIFSWGGDYSSAGTPNYKSTAGNPETGKYDIAFTVTSPYGLFQPYAGGTVPLWNFNSTGYNYLTVDLKPTVANQAWQVYFMQVGDKDIINAQGQREVVPLSNYGPAPVVGQWATYKIPLTDVLTQYSSGTPVFLQAVYKFAIQDQTGLASNVWYVDNLGFTVN